MIPSHPFLPTTDLCAPYRSTFMRIGIVCYPTFGGSGVVATELGLALAEEGHTVHFITYDRPVRLGTGLSLIHISEPTRPY